MKPIAALLLSLFAISQILSAQLPIHFTGPNTVIGKVNAGGALQLADVNGDGLDDVITSSLQIQINLGGGIFGPVEEVVDSYSTMHAIKAVDFDNDGDIDVIGHSHAAEIVFYENQGSADFLAPQLLYMGTAPTYGLIVEDLDGNGFKDIAIGGSQLQLFFNSGTGLGSPVGLVSPVFPVRDIHVEDLDGDGFVDILYSDILSISWFKGLGAGSFAAPSLLHTGNHSSIYAADVEGDGDADVVFGINDYEDGEIWWYENLGGASFASAVLAENNISGVIDFVMADVNGDGYQTVLMAGYEEANYIDYTATGWASASLLAHDEFFLRHVATGDTNGDGFQDVLYDLDAGLSLRVYNGSGFDYRLVSPSISNSLQIASTDFDNDSDQDIFLLTGSQMVSFRNVAAGEYFQIIPDNWELGVYSDMAVLDFNQDDYRDVAVPSYNPFYGDDGAIDFFRNTGNGALAGPQELIDDGNNFFTQIEAADLDGDGDDEIICANNGSSVWELYWLEATGGTSTSVIHTDHFIDGGAGAVNDLDVADIDGDGDRDIVMIGSSVIHWYANDGSGGFGTAMTLLPISPREIAFADLNADGDEDLVYLEGTALKVALGVGTGFGPAVTLDSAIELTSELRLFDLTGDGLAEISLLQDMEVNQYRNDGAGNFALPPSTILTEPYTRTHSYGDMDGDNDLDLILAYSGRVYWYANEVCGGAPTGLTAAFPFPGSLQLNWIAVQNATIYQLQGRVVGTAGFARRYSPTNSKFIAGPIPAGTNMEWRVTAACEGDTTEASALSTFTTPLLKTDANLPGATAGVQLFPNPSSDYFEVSLAQVIWDRAHIQLRKIDGTLLAQKRVNASAARFDLPAAMEAGSYLVELRFEWENQLVVETTEKIVVR